MGPAAKASEHVQARPGRIVASDGTLQVRVRSDVRVDADGALVVDDVEVTVDGRPVTGLSLPWRFVNPPLLVPDPDGDVDLGERGRFRRDPAAALKTMLVDVARSKL